MVVVSENQPLIFHEPGQGYLESVKGTLCEVTYGKSMKCDVKATLVDVEGGSSLFPIYTYISKKEGTIDIESATFSLSQTGIGQAIQLTTTGNQKNNRVLKTITDTSLGSSLTGVSNVKCIAPDGSQIAVTQTGTAPTGGVDVSATGTIKWDTGVPAGEYVFWFRSDSATAIKAGMLKNSMPDVCEFTWSLQAEDLDGSVYQVDIYAKRVRADGAFAIDATKGTASVPKLSLKILNPGDGTDNFCEITVSKVS